MSEKNKALQCLWSVFDQNMMHVSSCNSLNCVCVCVCVSIYSRSEEDSEGNRDICSEILQMKALERLTSTVSVCMFV